MEKTKIKASEWGDERLLSFEFRGKEYQANFKLDREISGFSGQYDPLSVKLCETSHVEARDKDGEWRRLELPDTSDGDELFNAIIEAGVASVEVVDDLLLDGDDE